MHLLAFISALLCVSHCSSQCSVQERGVSDADSKTIINKHNEIRSKVATGNVGNLPHASDMKKMFWDVELADIAQTWADECKFEEGFPDNDYPDYIQQSISNTSNQDPNPDWNGFMESIYDEGSKFDVNILQHWDDNPAADRFTQVIWADTNKVGCGYVRYQEGQNYIHNYFCNYAPGGLAVGEAPYLDGEPCSECDEGYGMCNEGLCQEG